MTFRHNNTDQTNTTSPTDAPDSRESIRPNHRARWAAIGAAIAVSLGAGGGFGLAQAAKTDGDKPVYVSIEPCRLLDTRTGTDNIGPLDRPLNPAETFTLDAHGTNGNCTIPSDALAIAANVTGVNATAVTFLTLFPQDAASIPTASNLNLTASSPPTPNMANIDLAANGQFNVFNNAGTVDVLIDIAGYYVDHNHNDLYGTRSASDFSGSIRTITSTEETIVSAFIDYPVAGQVIVNASTTADEVDAGGGVRCSIGETDNTLDVMATLRWESAGADGNRGVISGTRVFDVDPTGSLVGAARFEVFFVCEQVGASADAAVIDTSLSMIFVPTATPIASPPAVLAP
jgi:hypothetical protein